MHLRDIVGVNLLVCSSPRELPFLAERSDIVIVISNGTDVFALADSLRSIEKLSVRPALIVLGDHEIPWTPRPSSDLVILAPVAFLEWPMPPESSPELPFTD